MATLGNLLKMRGGLAMTPRIIPLTLTLPDPKGGAPLVSQLQVALLPVSHAAEARANRAAIDYTASRAEFGDAPLLEKELKFRFVVEAMRDETDLRKAFVELEYIETMRECLIGEHLDYLLTEYRTLIESEYCELLADAKELKAEAKALFPQGQD